jgi:rSAM/selenodomain-associated transferase 2
MTVQGNSAGRRRRGPDAAAPAPGSQGPPGQPTISVIVPVFNEVRRIRAQLEALTRLEGLHEVLVVDGGSTDGTLAEARGCRDRVAVIEALRGRARQMNAGAARATGDILLFLHADVALPSEAARLIRAALGPAEVVAGAFRTWTVPERPTWLRPLLHLADVRSRVTSLPYGDQAIFVRRSVFWQVGGFPELPILEDLVLAQRVRHLGRIARVAASVRVSGRRFQARPVFYTVLVNLIPTLFRLGVPAELLARLYGEVR